VNGPALMYRLQRAESSYHDAPCTAMKETAVKKWRYYDGIICHKLAKYLLHRRNGIDQAASANFSGKVELQLELESTLI